MEKCAEFGWESDLMNRFIHRSWGEGFVNIFLDLFINIFTALHRLVSVLWEERLKETYRSRRPRARDRGALLVKRLPHTAR